ncbi:MAG TPA: putative quinol monooxygenase [Solirubrobacteraceae bacterium]
MSDLNVVAVLKAKPGTESVVENALAALVQPTREEAGCISYELFRSGSDANTFITIEKWRSQEDLDAHLTTPHIAQALQAAGDALDGGPAIHPLAPVSG